MKKNDETIGRTGNGVLTQVFLDTQDDEITVAIINTYLAKAAEDYDEKNDDVDLDVYYVDNNGTSRKPVYMKTADEDKPQKQTISVDGEDFAIEEVAENDLFLVTIAQGVIQTMDAPEVLSDTSISNFRLEKYVTAGGTQYDYADTVMYDEEVLDQYDDANMKDVTYNVILDAYGYMIGIEQNEDPDQYVFLTGIDGKNSNLSVRNADANVIFMDGNMDTVTVNMTKSDIDTTGKNLSQLNTWCTYTVNNDNVYTLKEVAVSTSKNVIDDDTDVAQYAQDVGSNGATIDKKHVSLKAAN
ncbi:sn-glycerol-3-phosphate import ATP-binding protein UgpC, partial [Dysosmobacter welbionis]